MRALDLGALGVIVPMVSTPEQARLAAEAVRFPPHGVRSFGPVRNYYGVQPVQFEPLCLAMIETAQVVQNLDAILDTPGLDGVYVGPADLSQSITGKPQTDLTEPRLMEVLEQIVAGCKKRNLVAGIHVASPTYGAEIIKKGYQFVTILSDGRLLANACKQALDEIRGAAPAAAGKAEGPY